MVVEPLDEVLAVLPEPLVGEELWPPEVAEVEDPAVLAGAEALVGAGCCDSDRPRLSKACASACMMGLLLVAPESLGAAPPSSPPVRGANMLRCVEEKPCVVAGFEYANISL